MCKILYYHGLPGRFPELSSVNKSFTLAHFIQQVKWLSKRYELITTDEALNRSQAKNGLAKTVCLTTDDGMADNKVFAEIVADYGGRITMFLNTLVLDNHDLMWRHKVSCVASITDTARHKTLIGDLIDNSNGHLLPPPFGHRTLVRWSYCWPMHAKDRLANELWHRARLEPLSDFLDRHKPYLTWQQVRNLVSDGHAIGTHTVSHPDCSRVSWDDLNREVTESIRVIQEHTGCSVQALSYPFGRRPRPAWEQRLRHENPILKLLMGIAPMNGFESLEERESMEYSFLTALFNLYVQPYKRMLLF